MKIGDTVRFLNSVGGGRVIRIDGNIAHVEDEDGFEIPILVRECVVVEAAKPTPAVKPEPDGDLNDLVEIEETPTGEVLNITLGYEASNLKNLSNSTFDTYLVNDSNYYLYFSYMTRGDGDHGWTTRYAGVVEPNIQILIDTLSPDMPASIDDIALQYIALKQGNSFALKNPALVQYSFDATRLFKLHCYRDNPYFDNPVIAYDIIKDDRPCRQQHVDSGQLEKALRQKKAADRRPVIKRQLKKADRHNGDIIEVDLHIHQLIDNTNGLSPADMLNLQIDEFRRVMDENLRHHGQRIVFIHGKGEGVLRNAIMKELNHRYKGHQVQDASFQEYGYGATQVTI